MRQGTFDISALEKAVNKLGQIIERYKTNEQDDAIRDSVIQRFEFTYSIALRTLKKYFIEKAFVTEDINQMTFNDMVRTANQLNLLKSDLTKWSVFREMRNLTSHTYDEKIALQVAQIVPDFYNEISGLVSSIKGNNDKA